MLGAVVIRKRVTTLPSANKKTPRAKLDLGAIERWRILMDYATSSARRSDGRKYVNQKLT